MIAKMRHLPGVWAPPITCLVFVSFFYFMMFIYLARGADHIRICSCLACHDTDTVPHKSTP